MAKQKKLKASILKLQMQTFQQLPSPQLSVRTSAKYADGVSQALQKEDECRRQHHILLMVVFSVPTLGYQRLIIRYL